MIENLSELVQQPLVQALVLGAGAYGAIRADLKNMHRTLIHYGKTIAHNNTETNSRIDKMLLAQLRPNRPAE